MRAICTIFLLGCVFSQPVLAQHGKASAANPINIFDDLPIDDPASRSVVRPGEDPQQKIKQNIFVTVSPSAIDCYLGQPVRCTYSLYSCLQSTSHLVHPPAFAGFSVRDLKPSNETVNRKTIHGIPHRVFIIQQVQITPVQQGKLQLEPVVVSNTVSYKDGRKELEYDGDVSSPPVAVVVKPLPAGAPAGFAGAMGNFSVNTRIAGGTRAGEECKLIVAITGQGNFDNLGLPAIAWPAGVQQFEPIVTEEKSETAFPDSGRKVFTIPFVASAAGRLTIPAISFAYFNWQKKVYGTASAAPVTIEISAALPGKPAEKSVPPPLPMRPGWLWYLGIGAMLVALFFIFTRRRKNRAQTANMAADPVPVTEDKPAMTDIDWAGLQALPFNKAYIQQSKEQLSLLLQAKTGIRAASEEQLIAAVAEKSPVAANNLNRLFVQCNQLLYAPDVAIPFSREAWEHELRAIVGQTNELYV